MLVNQHYCVNCTIKHLASAAVIAREILNGYDTPEYRFYLIGNLNEAQSQLAGVDHDLSEMIRSLRLAAAPSGLETRVDGEWIGHVERVARAVDARRQAGVYSKKPDHRAAPSCRCGTPRRPDSAEPVDVIIPLRFDGSVSQNAELRFALRSIQRHLKGYRKIWVLSKEFPVGFRDVEFVRTVDDQPRKQMNIHRALLAAFRTPGMADEVLFWADDNVLLADLDVRELPVVARTDGLLTFSGSSGARVWHRSLRQTGEALQSKGFPTVNYEAHTPVRFNRLKYLALESQFDFYAGVGLCYISLYLNYYGVVRSVPMREVKMTVEKENFDSAELKRKQFLGYNDCGLGAGLKEELSGLFPERSKFEPYPVRRALYAPGFRMGVVIGTYGSAAFVELQLAALARFHPLPVLVVDDGSEDPALPELCERYGAKFRTFPERYGHRAGDLRIFAAALEWAAEEGISLLVKLSRRFVPVTGWAGELRQLAAESNAVTFSSHTTSFGYGFRTECIGLFVPAWRQLAGEILARAVPGERIGVEKFLHNLAIRLEEEWLSAELDQFRRKFDSGPGRRGYAPWKTLLGTDRKAPPPGVLWHDAHTPGDYAAAAKQLGLPLSEEAFR